MVQGDSYRACLDLAITMGLLKAIDPDMVCCVRSAALEA